jgi:hypothetical protein
MTATAQGRGRVRDGACVAMLALVGGAGTAGCAGSTTTTYVDPYDQAYVVTGYYPADLTYSTYYWADDWNYSTLYYYAIRAGSPLPLAAADAGAPASPGSTAGDAANAIQSAARGGTVCPGQMDVTPRTAPPICPDGQTTDERSGVTLSFRSCQLVNEMVQGTVDVTSMRTPSDPSCGPGTTLTLQASLAVTGLQIAKGNGSAVVIPSLTSNVTTAPYTPGQNPSTFHATTTGELQLVPAGGGQAADLMYQGDQTFTLDGSQDVSVSGTMALNEQNSGSSAMLTQTGLTRAAGCCWPTGGSLVVDRTGGSRPGKTTWEFGPNCGDAKRNGGAASLPACAQ